MSNPSLADLDAAPVGLFLVDHLGRPIYANRLALDVMGYRDLDEARSHKPHKLLQEFDAKHLFKRLSLGGDLRDHHVLAVNHHGAPQVICLDAKGLVDQQGFRGVVGSFRLVSSLRHHPDILMEHVPTPTYMVQVGSDGEERLAFCNQSYADLLAYSDPLELEGMAVASLHASPESHETLLSAMRDSQERSIVQEVELVKRTGKVVPVEVHAAALRDRGCPVRC